MINKVVAGANYSDRFHITVGLTLIANQLAPGDSLTLRIILTRIKDGTVKNRSELVDMVKTLKNARVRCSLDKLLEGYKDVKLEDWL